MSSALQVVAKAELPGFEWAERIVRVESDVVLAARGPRIPSRTIDPNTLEVRRAGTVTDLVLAAEPSIASSGSASRWRGFPPLWDRPFSGALQVFVSSITP